MADDPKILRVGIPVDAFLDPGGPFQDQSDRPSVEEHATHEYIPVLNADEECVICGCIERDGEPWLPCHEIPEGWE